MGVSRDGKIVLGSSGRFYPKLWHTETANEMNAPRCDGHLAADGSYLVSISYQWTVDVYDIASGNSAPTKRRHATSEFYPVISPGARYAVFRREDGAVLLWDVGADSEVNLSLLPIAWTPGQGYDNWFALSPDGTHLAIARNTHDREKQRYIEVWNLRDGFCYKPLSLDHSVFYLRLSSGGQYGLFVTEEDGLIRFECTDGEVRTVWEDRLSPEWTRDCAITPDGKRAVSVARNKVTLWDVEERRRLATFSGDGEATCCAIADDGSLIVVGEDCKRTVKAAL